MKKVLTVFVMVVAFIPEVGAQTSAPPAGGIVVPQKRVKALFLHALRDAASDVSSGSRSSVDAGPDGSSRRPDYARGLMYWIEVVDESGAMVRATTNRTIRSGERVRLHVTANVDGYLRTYRRGPSGEALTGFSDDRLSPETRRVTKGVPMAIPSESSWLAFSDAIDTERIVLVLTTIDPAAAPKRETRVPPNPGSYDEIASSPSRRGQWIEYDEQDTPPATYVVTIGEPALVDTTIAEIELRHEH